MFLLGGSDNRVHLYKEVRQQFQIKSNNTNSETDTTPLARNGMKQFLHGTLNGSQNANSVHGMESTLSVSKKTTRFLTQSKLVLKAFPKES